MHKAQHTSDAIGGRYVLFPLSFQLRVLSLSKQSTTAPWYPAGVAIPRILFRIAKPRDQRSKCRECLVSSDSFATRMILILPAYYTVSYIFGSVLGDSHAHFFRTIEGPSCALSGSDEHLHMVPVGIMRYCLDLGQAALLGVL